MAFRSQTAACFLALSVAAAAAQELSFEARHDHLWKSGTGILTFSETGVTYRENGNDKAHGFVFEYSDIQRLELAPKRVTLLTYEDSRLRLGADREHKFEALGGRAFSEAYEFLRDRLDERFVAVVSDEDVRPVVELPAKHLTTFGGVQGTLVIGEERIVFRPAGKGEARTWRLRDIENISATGPFRFTLATREKTFNFQLKQKLEESVYNDLWRRIFKETQ